MGKSEVSGPVLGYFWDFSKFLWKTNFPPPLFIFYHQNEFSIFDMCSVWAEASVRTMFPGSSVIITLPSRDSSNSAPALSALLGKQNHDSTNVLPDTSQPQTWPVDLLNCEPWQQLFTCTYSFTDLAHIGLLCVVNKGDQPTQLRWWFFYLACFDCSSSKQPFRDSWYQGAVL